MVNPRQGAILGIVFDAARDPVRKLAPDEPVIITVSVVLLWLIVLAQAIISRRGQVRSFYRAYPSMKTLLRLLLLALIPAGMMSTISYPRGWLMAVIGAASYLIPLAGILAGYILYANDRSICRFLRVYIIVNSLMLISVPLEYGGFDVPALGGIDAIWLRYRTGYIVNLMCGWYRSPDIMGLHAAHVVMFSLLLATRKGERATPVWIFTVLWAMFALLLSGRRKMIGVPLIFIAAFLTVAMIYRATRVSRLLGVLVASLTVGGAAVLLFLSPDGTAEYTEYAMTLFTEGGQRTNQLIMDSTIRTLIQTGVIGAGLGTATQGRYYTGTQSSRATRGWQEDGISRLFLEFGVAGVVLLVCCLILLLGNIRKSLRNAPQGSAQQLTMIGLLAVVVGDAASYTISPQQFSGDPVSALLVTLMIGMILRQSIPISGPPVPASTVARPLNVPIRRRLPR
jgi:hypothetical protein